jgi:hypothetical protein
MQRPLLERYRDLSNSRTCWVELIKSIGGGISSTHLSRTARGITTVRNVEIWEKIRSHLELKIKELENATNG